MNGQNGFSLVEALMALLIVGIVLVSGVAATMNGAGYVKATTHRIIAQGIAQGEIGKLRVLGYQQVSAMPAEMEVSLVIDEGDPLESDDSIIGTLTRTIQAIDMNEDGNTDLLRLEITIQWQEFGRQHQQVSTSFLTRRSFG